MDSILFFANVLHFYIYFLGVKAGLKRTYSAVTQDLLGVSKMPQWKPLLYAVAFLHTTVQVLKYIFSLLSSSHVSFINEPYY